MIIEFIQREKPKRSRVPVDVLRGLAGIYLDGQACISALEYINSGDDANIGAACTSIGEGVVRSYHDNKIDRACAGEEFKKLGLDVKTIPWPVAIALGRQYRGH